MWSFTSHPETPGLAWDPAMGNGMDQQLLPGRLKGGGDSTDKRVALNNLWLMLRKISPGRLLSHHSRSSWGLMDIPARGQNNTICFTGCPPPASCWQLEGTMGRDRGHPHGGGLRKAALYLELKDFDAVPVVPQLLL